MKVILREKPVRTSGKAKFIKKEVQFSGKPQDAHQVVL